MDMEHSTWTVTVNNRVPKAILLHVKKLGCIHGNRDGDLWPFRAIVEEMNIQKFGTSLDMPPQEKKTCFCSKDKMYGNILYPFVADVFPQKWRIRGTVEDNP